MLFRLKLTIHISILFLGLTLASSASAAITLRPPLNLGLVAYWSMDEGTGTQAGDMSGNGNTGTLTGPTHLPTWADGKRGKAVNFDGVDDYVDSGTMNDAILTENGAVTISIWAYAKGLGYYLGRSATANGPRLRGGGAESLTFRVDGTTDLVRASVDNIIQLNTWQNIVVTWDGSVIATNVHIYVNGTEIDYISSGNGVGLIDNSTLPVLVGNWGTANTLNLFNGLIDEVRVYNRALSATEVSGLYQTGAAKILAPNNLGLVGYWAMDEGTGTQAGDSSGNGNTGTITGATWVDGKRGQALDFDGSDYTQGTGINTTTFSASAWVFIKGGVGTTRPIFEYTPPASTSRYGLGIDSTNKARITHGGLYRVSTGAVLALNQWHHILVTNDGVNQQLYVNGVSEGLGASVFANTSTANLSRIGRSANTQSLYFNGLIDEVRVYNRALGATEVASLYNSSGKITTINSSQNSRLTSGLVGLWSFNGPDISGATAYDRAGSNNGTISGAVPAIGKVGQALNFNGTSDSIDLGNVYNGVKTVTFWVKTSDVNDNGFFEGKLDEVRLYSTALSAGEIKQLFNMGSSGSTEALSAVDPNTKILSLNATTGIKIVSGTITASGFTSPTIYVDGAVSSAIDDQWRFVAITTGTGINASASTLALGSAAWACGDTIIYNSDIYNTVQMTSTYGSQCWLGENLRTIYKSDGVTSITSYCHGSGCGSPWGRLYTWTTAMNDATTATGCGAKIQGICPSGWHIPSDYTSCSTDDFPALGTDGGALKKVNTSSGVPWAEPNTGATNASNWTGYPAGSYVDGSFNYRGNSGYLWSSAEISGTMARFRYLVYNDAGWVRSYSYKTWGFSVRCVKD